jgi:hypothetical protein
VGRPATLRLHRRAFSVRVKCRRVTSSASPQPWRPSRLRQPRAGLIPPRLLPVAGERGNPQGGPVSCCVNPRDLEDRPLEGPCLLPVSYPTDQDLCRTPCDHYVSRDESVGGVRRLGLPEPVDHPPASRPRTQPELRSPSPQPRRRNNRSRRPLRPQQAARHNCRGVPQSTRPLRTSDPGAVWMRLRRGRRGRLLHMSAASQWCGSNATRWCLQPA